MYYILPVLKKGAKLERKLHNYVVCEALGSKQNEGFASEFLSYGRL